MKTTTLKIITISILSLLMAGCFNQKNKTEGVVGQESNNSSMDQNEGFEYIQMDDSLKLELVKKGGIIAGQATLSLQRALKDAIKEGGLEYAINFCNIKAIPITDSVSDAESVEIRRLAKKYRNPINETDSTESELYKSYILEWLGGQQLTPKIVPDDEGHPVYYNPIYVGALCLNCHGEIDNNIKPELAETINKLYPADKATDFKLGQLRGMWAITFKDMKVN